jgi:hypothetical protein
MKEQMSTRIFKIWDYNVSHNQLLIRSPRNESLGVATNIDIKFRGVSHMNIPTSFNGCEIVEPNLEEINEIKYITSNNNIADISIFIILSAGKRYSVTASSCKISENDMDIFETSLECFGHENIKWQSIKTTVFGLGDKSR